MRRLAPPVSLLFLSIACAEAPAQPPTLTPRINRPMHQTRVVVPARYAGAFPENVWVWVPEGWGVKVFHAGNLSQPRFLDWGPDSVLHVADLRAARVLALPDRDRDGVADTSIVAADNVAAHDVAFFRGAMYAAEAGGVLKLTDGDGDGYYETREKFIEDIPSGGHITRTIVFDTLRGLVYLSVGSSCNACRDSVQAVIYAFALDGSAQRIFASGTRNAVGLTMHPVTGKLWATNNGQDWQGDDIPPEWISIVRDGGFYGFPIAYSDQRYFDFQINGEYRALLPITAADSARVRSMLPFSAEVTAHSAPMAIQFANASSPAPYAGGAFVALHGSWNRSAPSGYKIVHLDFDGPQDTIANSMSYVLAADTSEASSPAYAFRPCGLAVDAHGNLYFSSDHQNAMIGLLFPRPLPGMADESSRRDASVVVGPNPADETAGVLFTLASPSRCALEVFDALGARAALVVDNELSSGQHRIAIDTRSLPSGAYQLRFAIGSTVVTRSLVVQH